MRIQNTFTVPLPVDEAWNMLIDIERIAPCVPGATLLEAIDQSNYKGQISVRLGPVTIIFDGEAKFENLDYKLHKACVIARGADTRWRGGAEANVTFRLEPDSSANSTSVFIDTDLKLSGSIAQYGRGSGMISDLANIIIKDFSECLDASLSTTRKSEASLSIEHKNQSKPIYGTRYIIKLCFQSITRIARKIFNR